MPVVRQPLQPAGEEHERTFDSCQSLAGALEGQCKFREAEQLRRAALSIVATLEAKSDMHLPAETYGMRTAAVAGRLGFDLNRQGKYAEAEPLLRRAIRLWPMDPWLLDALAESVLRQERFTEASGLLNQSQKIRQQLKRRKVNAGRRPAG